MGNFFDHFRRKPKETAQTPAQPAPTPAPKPTASMGDEEKFRKLSERLLAYAAEEAFWEGVPAEGKFRPKLVSFENPMRRWCIGRCGLQLNAGFNGADQRMLEIFATFPDDDRKMSNYWRFGTREEIVAFVSDPARIDEMREIFEGFSEKIRMHD